MLSGNLVALRLLTLPLAMLVVLSSCGRSMMETPLIYRDASFRYFGELPPELQGDPVQILYATDRKAAHPDYRGSRFYGNGRSKSGVLGIAEVRIGRTAVADAGATGPERTADTSEYPVSRTPVEVVSVEELIRFPETPYLFSVGERGRIVLDPEVVAELEQAVAATRRELVRRLALTPKKEVYVFVHGVGNEFDDAVITTAEYWHFLGREGVPIAYSWPAGAKGLFFYAVDRESGEFTVLHMKQFLRILADIPEVEKIHIATHSRGTDIATTALRELVIESRALGEDPRERFKIENLILVAADLDLEVTEQRLVGEALGPAVGRVTIYTNASDSALARAKLLFSSRQRVGALTPTALTPHQREIVQRAANLNIIVYEGTGGGFFRHSYYSDPVAGSDMLMLLRYGSKPGEGRRQGLERISPRIWRIKDEESEAESELPWH